jgi:protocatechuate 3,4-dioxygenase, beta subunit
MSTKGDLMQLQPPIVSRRTVIKRGLSIIVLLAGGWIVSSSLAKMLTQPTPRQSLGPFFPDEGDEVKVIREFPDPDLPISQANDQDLTFVKNQKGKAAGQVIYLRGSVRDAKTGQPIPDTMIILWSASASGRYNHKGDEGNTSFPHPKTGETIHRTHDEYFQYWGRALTNEQGEYWFKTIVPGFYPIDLENGLYRPSHLHFEILSPAHTKLVTQLYFRGNQIPNNALNQELLPKDVVILDAGLSPKEQEKVIVDYAPDPSGKITDGLVGYYDFVVPS